MIADRAQLHHRRIWLLVGAVLAVVASAALLPATAPANHQPICQQYPDLAVCDHGGEGEDDDDGDVGPGAGAGDGGAGLGGADGGELPFTGYPLTPLLLLLLALLATGLAIRGYLFLRERRRAPAASAFGD